MILKNFKSTTSHLKAWTAYNPFLGNSEYTLTGGGQAQGVPGVMVAGNFFEVLGGGSPRWDGCLFAEELQKNGQARRCCSAMASGGGSFNAEPGDCSGTGGCS